MDIGKRIKKLRAKRGLTLEELASRSELTKGFLSQLERNLTSPSISTLEDIVSVLGISLQEFFKEEPEEKIAFTRNDYSIDEQEGKKITWLVPQSVNNDMEPILLELSPNEGSYEIKPHDGEEFGYVLRGRIVLKDLTNDESYVIRKGETFYLRGEFTHQLINESDQVAKVLWVSTPPIF